MAPHLARGVKHIANQPKALAIAMASVFFGCSLAYMLVEHKGPIESMWWAIVTGATVGYGDQYPETTAGRFVGAVLIVSFVIMLVLAGAQITAKLVSDPDCFTDAEQEEIKALLRDLSEKVNALDNKGIRHQIIVNSISELNNDELRKLLDVQKSLNGGLGSA